jgi:hypothetical protein
MAVPGCYCHVQVLRSFFYREHVELVPELGDMFELVRFVLACPGVYVPYK